MLTIYFPYKIFLVLDVLKWRVLKLLKVAWLPGCVAVLATWGLIYSEMSELALHSMLNIFCFNNDLRLQMSMFRWTTQSEAGKGETITKRLCCINSGVCLTTKETSTIKETGILGSGPQTEGSQIFLSPLPFFSLFLIPFLHFSSLLSWCTHVAFLWI